LSLQDLHECATAVAAGGDLVGVEIGEYEGPDSAGVEELLDALAPVLPKHSHREGGAGSA